MRLPWEWPLRYKALFSTAEGYAVLMDMARRYRVFRTNAPKDPRTDAYLKGQRDVVLNLIEMLGIDEAKLVEQYNQQMKDNHHGTSGNTGQR
jgi:hypothetical protein